MYILMQCPKSVETFIHIHEHVAHIHTYVHNCEYTHTLPNMHIFQHIHIMSRLYTYTCTYQVDTTFMKQEQRHWETS